MARDRQKKKDEGAEIPGWVVTYGDMMSLLLCFFVLLLSFSTISEEAFNQALMSLQGAFGVLPRFDSLFNPVPRQPKEAQEAMERMARKLKRQMQVMGKDTDIDVQFDLEGGLKINLPNKILFESGNANLKPDAYAILNEVAEVLRDVPDSFIEVRGHTDARPMSRSTEYRDNYDLSYGRADAVVRRLNTFGNIPMNQFEIVACGPSRPIATNTTADGQRANRRVEIFVRGAFNRDRIEEWRNKVDAMEEAEETQNEETLPQAS